MPNKILGFGASSMEGVGDEAGGGFFKRIQPAFKDCQFVNLGMGGHTTREMLARCGQAVEQQPYDLLVLLGCNDFPRDNDRNPQLRTSLEEYARNLARILSTIKGRRNIFMTSFQVDRVKSGVSAETFDLYIRRAHALAVEAGYEIIDLYSIMRATRHDYLAADGVHFNAQGHQAMADLAIAALLGSAPDPVRNRNQPL